MKLNKLFIILGLMLVCLSFVSAENIKLIETETLNDFSYTGGNIKTSNGISLLNTSDEIFYLQFFQNNDGLTWDKLNFNGDIYNNTDIRLQAKAINKTMSNEGLMYSFTFENGSLNSTDNIHSITAQGNSDICSINQFKTNSFCSYSEETDGGLVLDNYNLSTHTGNLTIDIWITPFDNLPSGGTMLLKKQAGISGTDGYQVFLDSNNFRLYYGNGSSNQLLTSSVDPIIRINMTTRLSITYNSDTKQTCFYQDNNQLNCQTGTLINGIAPGSSNLQIGYYTLGHPSIKSFNGSINQISVYDVVKTEQDFAGEDYRGTGIPVLYTHQADCFDTGDYIRLCPENANNHFSYMNQTGWSTITWQDLYQYSINASPFPKRRVLFKTDAGYDTVYTGLTPYLDLYGFQYNIEILSASQNTGAGSKLTWSEVAEAVSEHGWGIGNYAYNDLGNWANIKLEQAISEMINNKQSTINNLSIIPYGKTFPYGSWFNNTNVSFVEACYEYYPFCVAVMSSVIGRQSHNSYTINDGTDFTQIIGTRGYTQNVSLDTFKLFIYGTGSDTELASYHNTPNSSNFINSDINSEKNELLRIEGRILNYTDSISPVLNEINIIKINQNAKNNNMPFINEYNDNVLKINSTFNTITKEVFLSCDGNEVYILVDGLNYIKGDKGFYDVYHNGIFVESVNTDTYTITSCSTWTFSPSNIVPQEFKDQALNPMLAGFSIIMIGIIVAVGFALIKAFEGGDAATLTMVAAMAIGVTIVCLIGVYILGQISTIVP